MKITFQAIEDIKGDVVILTDDGHKLPQIIADDAGISKIANHAMKAADFTGKFGKHLVCYTPDSDVKRIIIIGTGKDEDIKNLHDLERLGGLTANMLHHLKVADATIVVDGALGGFSADHVAAHAAYGIKLKSYRFNHYFEDKKDGKDVKLASLTIASHGHKTAETKFETLSAVADGVFLARDVVAEPANILYPESYAERCKELKNLGVKVEVLDEKEMQKLGMGALLGVGQGSERPSRLVVMQWQGDKAKAEEAPLAFVGKGVTFDTGGISIKPSLNMHDMKYDMGGSAAVVGLMKALAGRKAKANVIGVIGLVENMPDGNAQRPGDVVTSMSGQTIEVLNTDAEGRLVLADALWYTQDRFNPKFMINLATLTGAIVVALGSLHAGLFSNNDELSEKLLSSGIASGEKLWRFPVSPLGEGYDKHIDSKIADLQNIGNVKGGGSITASQFLQRFVNDTPWAHLDIAGAAWADKAQDVTPEGAVGFGVRLLNQLVADHYES